MGLKSVRIRVYYLTTLTIECLPKSSFKSHNLQNSSFSSLRFVKICKVFAKHLSNMSTIECRRRERGDSWKNGMHISSCFLNIGRSKILDLKEHKSDFFLHKWNRMDWRKGINMELQYLICYFGIYKHQNGRSEGTFPSVTDWLTGYENLIRQCKFLDV